MSLKFDAIGYLYSLANNTYSINPSVFIALYFFSFIPFYYGVWRIYKGLKEIKGSTQKLSFTLIAQNKYLFWGIIILVAAYDLPFFYVLFFGRNLPWYAYVPIVFLIIVPCCITVRKALSGKINFPKYLARE